MTVCPGWAQDRYEDGGNPAIHDWIRQLTAMTALPAFAIPLIWDWWLRFPSATGSVATDCKLQADYFHRTWVSGEFLPELWSQYDNNQQASHHKRTAEGWHNSLPTSAHHIRRCACSCYTEMPVLSPEPVCAVGSR